MHIFANLHRPRLLGVSLCALALTPILTQAAPWRPDPTESLAPTPDALASAQHLLERWAPIFVQEVDDDDQGQDRPMRVDFDGDWDATNNWEHQPSGWRTAEPVAYGAAVLTPERAFLTYTLFYPRDWMPLLCAPLVCHDNDLEVVQLVVDRRGPDGSLALVETKTHKHFDSHRGAEVVHDHGRPLVHVESQGHGMRACTAGSDCVAGPGSILYEPGVSKGPPPERASGQRVSYALLDLHDSLWSHRGVADQHLWSSDEPLRYQPSAAQGIALLGIAMASKHYRGGVRPPWGLLAAPGRRGDWFLDPAPLFAARHGDGVAGKPGEPVRYELNLFLDDVRREVTPLTLPQALSPAITGSGALFGLGLGLVRGGRRRRRS